MPCGTDEPPHFILLDALGQWIDREDSRFFNLTIILQQRHFRMREFPAKTVEFRLAADHHLLINDELVGKLFLDLDCLLRGDVPVVQRVEFHWRLS